VIGKRKPRRPARTDENGSWNDYSRGGVWSLMDSRGSSGQLFCVHNNNGRKKKNACTHTGEKGQKRQDRLPSFRGRKRRGPEKKQSQGSQVRGQCLTQSARENEGRDRSKEGGRDAHRHERGPYTLERAGGTGNNTGRRSGLISRKGTERSGRGGGRRVRRRYGQG